MYFIQRRSLLIDVLDTARSVDTYKNDDEQWGVLIGVNQVCPIAPVTVG